MENKFRYTADILFNGQSISSHSSNNLNQLTAQLIIKIEQTYPNATGQIKDNNKDEVINTYRRAAFE